jgi:hypothetical protein
MVRTGAWNRSALCYRRAVTDSCQKDECSKAGSLTSPARLLER